MPALALETSPLWQEAKGVLPLISMEEAESLILSSLEHLPAEHINADQAYQRVLRHPIFADRPAPPFDRVMMDGIAIHSSSTSKSFIISGTQAAGAPALHLIQPDHCLEVMTGAPLPSGTDTVIPVEQIEVSGQQATLLPTTTFEPGQFIHRTGSDCAADATALPEGIKLSPMELAIAASVGAMEMSVSKLPSIHLLTTGDEVIDPTETPTDFQIRRSHPSALIPLIEGNKLGKVKHVHLADDPDAIDQALAPSLEQADVLILTGGISMGKFDWVAPLLRKHLGEPHFHGVAQRPGKPFAYWKSHGSPSVFALPGNPVSVTATATRYLLPALMTMLGMKPTARRAPLAGDFLWSAPLTGILPYTMQDGCITLHPPRNSGDYLTLAGKQGFAVVSEPKKQYTAGTLLDIYPFF
ncbi:molybdopterin molybdotransferase [Rubritalea squalenifaciens DSM 18772]|uniref:Molybdopterin molybdenumtransferase n=1 Tax=Rubritalea squalenifaciens DSM 18772 TaxID=1123071 RepID=A0A1M6J9R7_9BACT|nr:molybdopterin molybdotransferase MoeA [Rubritalea squalenifaciens]SHJ43419.1 molybdopterin molybdotransferase [Rubritalea squalenifaciens DSM 18772]